MQNFSNSNQFRAYMKKESDRLGISINNAYTTFFSRILLEKLSKYNDGKVLVKGSSAEIAYLGRLVRGITDIDIATIGPIETNVELIRAILDDKTISDFNFKLAKRPKVTPTGIYKMSFESSFDKIRQTVGIDFQENYNRLIEKEIRTMPKIFDGDDEYQIIVPSFEEYLAEKLCIIIESNKTDVLNTRVKDFYDIYQLHGGKYNPEKLTRYFGKMLELRGKINIKEASTLYLDKNFIKNHEALWEKAKEKYDFIDDGIDLYGAVYYARAVIREELQKNGSEMPNPIKSKKLIKQF